MGLQRKLKRKRLKAKRHQSRSESSSRFALGSPFKRHLQIERAHVDQDGTVELSFSSEEPVRDFFGPPVVLLHERSAVDLSRLDSMLLNHSPDRILGAVVEKRVDKDDRRGRAVARFDDDELATTMRKKVESGSLRGVSVQYTASKAQRIGEGEKWKSPEGRSFEGPLIVATRWQPIELSLTPIPADSQVGVGRSDRSEEEMNLSEELKQALRTHGFTGDFDDQAAVLRFLSENPGLVGGPGNGNGDEGEGDGDGEGEGAGEGASAEARADAGDADRNGDQYETGRLAERRRHQELRRIATDAEVPAETLDSWLNGDIEPRDARLQALEHWRRSNQPIGQSRIVDVGDSAVERLNKYAFAGFCRRLGHERDDSMPKDAPDYFTFEGYIKERLRLAGQAEAAWMGIHQIVARRDLFAHATDDFANLLENVANKDLRRGYTEAPTTYQAWTTPRDMRDFKQHSSVNFGQAQVYQLTPELTPIGEQTISDAKETFTLATYGNRFSLSRQALINDDLGGFSRIVQLLGAAAARTINQGVYDHVNSNPTMTEDSIALFGAHTSGNNLSTSAGAPTSTRLSEGRRLMRLQKGLGTSPPTLNLVPSIVISPAAHEQVLDELVRGAYVPTAAANAPIPFVRSLSMITDGYLDGLDANAWYMVANPMLIDTVIVGRLSGQGPPVIQRQVGTDILGVAWVAYIDYTTRAVDHRGMFKNAGA